MQIPRRKEGRLISPGLYFDKLAAAVLYDLCFFFELRAVLVKDKPLASNLWSLRQGIKMMLQILSASFPLRGRGLKWILFPVDRQSITLLSGINMQLVPDLT